MLGKLPDVSFVDRLVQFREELGLRGAARGGEGVKQALPIARGASGDLLLRILWLGSWVSGFPDSCSSRGACAPASVVRPGSCPSVLSVTVYPLTHAIVTPPAHLPVAARARVSPRPRVMRRPFALSSVRTARFRHALPAHRFSGALAPNATLLHAARAARSSSARLLHLRHALCRAPTAPSSIAPRPAQSARARTVPSGSTRARASVRSRGRRVYDVVPPH